MVGKTWSKNGQEEFTIDEIVDLFLSGEGTFTGSGNEVAEKANLEDYKQVLYKLAYDSLDGVDNITEDQLRTKLAQRKADGYSHYSNEYQVYNNAGTPEYKSAEEILEGLYTWYSDPNHATGIDWRGEDSPITGGIDPD
jgi:hypothetical protein